MELFDFINKVHQGDSIKVMRDIPSNSIDSCVCDSPYELGFMGKKWDASGIAYNVNLWKEVFRVLKPGGHLLSFGGTRTYHRMACAIEDVKEFLKLSMVQDEYRKEIYIALASKWMEKFNLSKDDLK